MPRQGQPPTPSKRTEIKLEAGGFSLKLHLHGKHCVYVVANLRSLAELMEAWGRAKTPQPALMPQYMAGAGLSTRGALLLLSILFFHQEITSHYPFVKGLDRHV